MELIHALRTTGAVREFLPGTVPREVIHRVLDTARFAPSGGNRQGWRVVVVEEPAIRAGLRDLYLRGWNDYLAQLRAGLTPYSPLNDPAEERRAAHLPPGTARPAAGSGGSFAEHLDQAPALLAVLVDLGAIAAVDRELERYGFAGGASVYPFAWSVLLAAREEGLGGVITTMAVRAEPEVKALLHAPAQLALAALIALGRPRRQPSRLTRAPVEEFTTIDRCSGEPLEGPR